MSATTLRRARPSRRVTVRAAGREQALMAAGQLLAGGGNLAFALLCAHILPPGQYSLLAAFLAAYLLLYMPFSALSAGGAIAPTAIGHRRRQAVQWGGAVALGLIIVAAAGLGPDVGLGTPLLLLLAAAAPVAGLLALERGSVLGSGLQSVAITSLLSEPGVRLSLGVLAALALGAPGAAGAVVLGGYAATMAASRGWRERTRAPAVASGGTTSAVTAAFLLLAVLQNQDVLWANARLGGAQAAHFAVLSTLGGIAAFASTTVPLVLLPRVRRRESGALTAALGAAVLLGLAAMLPALADSRALITVVFGARYAAVAPLAVPYLGAMALLGVSRVIVAYRCATGSPRPVLVLLTLCALIQALIIAAFAGDAAGVADATLIASATLAIGLTLLTVLTTPSALGLGSILPAPRIPGGTRPRAPRSRRQTRPRLRAHATPILLGVGGLTLGGLIIRMLAGRSLWLDEATSITQSHLSFSGMLDSLRNTDVQPPLHDVLLWVINHLFGDSELAMRSPSLICGSLLIPVVYVIGRDLWDRRTGLVAAVLVTFAPFVIWYSQEARMYAVFMLLASLALWAQVRILRAQGPAVRRQWGWWGLYSLSTAALAWTQYFGLLVAAVQQGAFVAAMIRRPEQRRALIAPWLASLVLMAVLVAPLAPFVLHQYQVNQATGRGFGATPSQNGTDLEAGHRTPTVYAVLTNLVWGVWGYHSTPTMEALTALWPVGILLSLAMLGRGSSWRTWLLMAVAGLPVAALFAVGQLKPFLFEIRYFCAGVPVVMLLLARLCATWPGKRTLGVITLTSAFVLSFGVAFADQQLSQTNPRLYDFQGALARISRQMKPGDELLYTPQFLNNLVGYYAPGVHSAPLGSNPTAVAPHGHVFLMASFQEQPQNAAAVRTAVDQMLRAGRPEIRFFTRPQVEVWEFR